MSPTRLQFVLVVFSIRCVFPFAQGAGDTWIAVSAQGHRLYGEGRYAEAEAAFRNALREAERQEHSEHIATSLNHLSSSLAATGRLAEAEGVLLRAVALWERLGKDESHMAMTLHNLADTYSRQARYDEAARLYLRVAKEWTKRLGPRHPDAARAWSGLAAVRTGQGEYAGAEKLYHHALSILDGQVPYPLMPSPRGLCTSDDPFIGSTLNNLSLLVSRVGRGREAVSFAQRALEIQRRCLPDGHPDIGVSLNNLGAAYQSVGKFKEAEVNYRMALEFSQRAASRNPSDLASALTNLGDLCFLRRRSAEAVEYHLRALGIFEKSLGPSHPDVALTSASLADAYLRLSNFGLAEQYCQRSLSIWRGAAGTNHPQYAIGLTIQAQLFRRTNRKKEAKSLDRQAKEIVANHNLKNGNRAVVSVRTLAGGRR